MKLTACFATAMSLALLGCANKSAEKKTASAPEAPVSAGYEAAIAAQATKPIFRPSGTAPAVWGPGDLYSLLVTGEESNNALSSSKQSFRRAADRRRMCTAERMRRSTS
jgi:hypothetical protein